MSKTTEAKAAQGYDPKPLQTCTHCEHYRSETALPAWAVKANAGKGRTYTLGEYGKEGKVRCALGGFAIKKTASCQKFTLKKA